MIQASGRGDCEVWGSVSPASCVYVHKETGNPGNLGPRYCIDWVPKGGVHAICINCPLTDLHPELPELETGKLPILPIFV